ncbi:MAG: tryptophan--tRNA ligase [Gammaproteobacteria bacterium RIFCSPLOWO2_02_FULL_38_11]|nr:MAG: tryptophan--tRNA ligase [Gammaproteobacteria bacterium RIFCSPHIGHO2_02_FULL_38_33]OGT24097.1 MAG: tryptophan--tRNA ligase [Gammaproteobacteria bacterium RIFCSPHIGHO2_12_38_15]OGT67189.1 MAG: tryptophan--tRNA ligase [Gammaproteobacteria bacterium RIFCSPLOWO2_02_FULL_38_11]OGT77919.1 MAG: tryptophan--tRNA ligase [Gammaproteobacteria bacterium RIFCSPLOWO2_12_FULL_38_14]
MEKPRLLTGDTPTGKLHLGHWVGSVENRVAMQKEYDCYFILANMQAFTTHINHPSEVRQHVFDVTLDYLAAGIDPNLSTIFIQSEVPAIAELTFLFSMMVSYSRVMRNPTLKDEIRDKGLGDHYSFGFVLYPISQIADILAFRPDVVPVGEDQLPHLELATEVARRFNILYCNVDPHVSDEAMTQAGGLFPVVKSKLGKVKRLVGLGGPNAQGQLCKMSKSLNNAIYLSDDNDTVYQKVMSIYTDPQRVRATDPGKIDNNPLWIFHDAFNPDLAWIQEAKEKYQHGKIGDVECKKKLAEAIISLLQPMQERRKQYKNDKDSVLEILKKGTIRANVLAENTLSLVKEKVSQDYFSREITYK